MTLHQVAGRNDEFRPLARKSDLITRQIPGELLVYDLKRHKAMCLNETAAIVWKKCDGRNTIADLTAGLESRYGFPIDQRVIWLALDQLEKSYLLAAKPAWPKASANITRREVMQAGIVAAIALPVITIIVAPTAVSAATAITDLVCRNRLQSDPGGCGGNPCLVVTGNCVPQGANKCRCN